MKELNMNIKVDDIKIAESQDNDLTSCQIFLNWIENAVVSIYVNENGQPIPVPDRERRKLDKLLNKLDEHKEGVIELTDSEYALLQEKWKTKKFTAVSLTRNLRKLLTRMDLVIIPDEINKDED